MLDLYRQGRHNSVAAILRQAERRGIRQARFAELPNKVGAHGIEILSVGRGIDGDDPEEILLRHGAGHPNAVDVGPALLILRNDAGHNGVDLRCRLRPCAIPAAPSHAASLARMVLHGLGTGFCRAGVQRSEQGQKTEVLFLRDRDAAVPREALPAARQPFAPLLSAPSAPGAGYIASVQAAAMRYAAPPPTPEMYSPRCRRVASAL